MIEVNKRTVIMINGVDVYFCYSLNFKGISPDYKPYCKIFKGDCEKYDRCYFKEYKRKFKECQKLQSTINEIEQYCLEKNLKWDNFARDVLCIIDKSENQ